MKTSSLFRPLFIASAIVTSATFSHADEKTDQGVEAAKSWLSLVDGAKYEKSWESAAPFFKKTVSNDAWAKMLEAIRKPLGGVKSRELLAAKYVTTLPGSPDGEYVVIQFKTQFDAKADAIETITPMKDEKGAWRVSGYFIK